jgi:hypothetical protein
MILSALAGKCMCKQLSAGFLSNFELSSSLTLKRHEALAGQPGRHLNFWREKNEKMKKRLCWPLLANTVALWHFSKNDLICPNLNSSF